MRKIPVPDIWHRIRLALVDKVRHQPVVGVTVTALPRIQHPLLQQLMLVSSQNGLKVRSRRFWRTDVEVARCHVPADWPPPASPAHGSGLQDPVHGRGCLPAGGDAGSDSDIDLAVLTEAPPDGVTLWELAGSLALLCDLHVDLLDLRAASTVMQHQVITTGKRIWASGSSAALYECFSLGEKTRLEEARAGLLQDITSRGTVHG